MKVERTTDAEMIRKVVCDRQVLNEMREEEVPYIPIADSIYHMIARDEEVMGIASFFPIDEHSWSPHMAVLPIFRGIGTELLRRSVEWMFANTACLELKVAVPEWNERMLHVFEKCGFKVADELNGHVMMTLRMERN